MVKQVPRPLEEEGYFPNQIPMKSLMALTPGGVGEPLGSAEEGDAGWEATSLDGDAVEAGDGDAVEAADMQDR